MTLVIIAAGVGIGAKISINVAAGSDSGKLYVVEDPGDLTVSGHLTAFFNVDVEVGLTVGIFIGKRFSFDLPGIDIDLFQRATRRQASRIGISSTRHGGN